ncbi:unnamed protein product [Rotaria magnacalcarata]|uniref:Uncharacterized protein n=1 Tax=Rotaria magnacalcarata TaxID=392030 RepID=A0A816BC09_9BILA|nr:unnamed protein product [Rotaria magnacalcarata]CAF1608078.1 unnamed protein product [Rotaria magnacalcarata]CAF4113737.1 unnamed protein product [Rotaria magnacalcarata]CAF4255957.1 unnamed protein product [Rotaria magnacalcarata]
MTGEEWRNYIITITINGSDPTLKEFFRDVDLAYWKYMRQLLESIRESSELIESALNEIANIIPTIDTLEYNTTKFESLWIKLDNELPHILMEHGNMLYFSYLRQARTIERKIRKLKDRYEDSILSPILRIPPSEMLYIDALIVSMRHKLVRAIFFANDALVAEGTIFFTGIEQYQNSVDKSFVKNRNLRINLLTNNQLYQSINEQYSGVLKDIKHYSQKQVHNGRIIYRSSKYLRRLLDTIIELGRNKWDRIGFADNQQTICLKLMTEELLLSIRKCKYPFDTLSSNCRAQLSEYFASFIFATDSPLEKFWEYRKSTLDKSSELFKYKHKTWNFMKASNYQKQITRLFIADLKTFAIDIRDSNKVNLKEVALTMTKILLKFDKFPHIHNTDKNNFIINVDEANPFDSLLDVTQGKSLIVKQFTSVIHNVVVGCNHRLYRNYYRGILDFMPDMLRYIFDLNRNRFNIVTTYTRQNEYRHVKNSEVDDFITPKNYIKAIISYLA